MATFDISSTESASNSQCVETENGLYWALNCYPVTLTQLLANCIFVIVGITSIALNIVTVQAVFQKGQIESVSDIAIVSLALTDVLGGIFLIYQSVYNVMNWQIFYECLFRTGMILATNLSSSFHLYFLTFDRYVKITRPYAYNNIFNRRAVITTYTVLWISAFCLCLSPMMGWNKRTERQCGRYYVVYQEYEVVVVFAFFIPLFVNYILYGHIFQIARKHAKEITVQTTVTGFNPRPSSQTWKFTKTVYMLVGVYTLCWSPSGILLLLDYFNHLNHMSPNDKTLALTYLFLPAFVYILGNPIIYACKINYIRRHYVKVFGKIPCCCCIRRE